MSEVKFKERIAILGGGPSGLFMFKRIVENGSPDYEIEIFERNANLGMGMPYSTDGASDEHITNVSDNEIPRIFNHIADWVKIAPKALLSRFKIDPERFNEYKVLPRLFFGEYLSAQFQLLLAEADKIGLTVKINLNTTVNDVINDKARNKVAIIVNGRVPNYFDRVIICTGHNWPIRYEDKISGYYDSPYPPKKISIPVDHPVGIRGASLTAIDAVRTLARSNGSFYQSEDGRLCYMVDPQNEGFSIVMHSRNGLLPAIRFHLEDSHLGKDKTLSKSEIRNYIDENDGFITLDYIFEKNFKEMFMEKEPDFYQLIKNMNIEEFVDAMMNQRERENPFELFKKEYAEAEKSIQQKESIYWKEMLAVLSFAMNYPAKYLPAEDMQRLQQVLMPLISLVIAFVPQSSCRDLMALYDAGLINLVSVGNESEVEPVEEGGAKVTYIDESGSEITTFFKTFVDCIGQPHLSFKDFPFQSLGDAGEITPALLAYSDTEKAKAEIEKGNDKVIDDGSGKFYLKVPGITINDSFQVVDKLGKPNTKIYIMAVPYIGGYNPDYSGIDFSEIASETIINTLLKDKQVV